MVTAKVGDRVRIDYIGTLEDGTVFDSTREEADCGSEDCGCGGPRELVVGEGEFLPRIEDALVGMSAGQKTTVIIPMDDAFGPYDVEKVFSIAKADLPADLQPEIGDEITLVNEDGDELNVTVAELGDDEITFDANHPLAGEDLTFEVELVEIL